MTPMIEAVVVIAGALWALAHLVLVVPRLPEPADAGNKLPYRTLVTPTAMAAVTVASLIAQLATVVVPRTHAPLWWVLGSAALVLVYLDLRTTYLPRAFMIICAVELAAALGLSLVLGMPGADAVRALSGAVASGAFYWLMWRLTRGGIGFGDVRLAPALGLVVAAHSWTMWWASMLAGSLIGVVWGLVSNRSRGGAFAYGPPMFLGPYVALALCALA